MEKVIMRSPKGEAQEVEATPEVLSPLMAAGWVQVVDPPQLQRDDRKKEK
jgi:hypothetical protein